MIEDNSHPDDKTKAEDMRLIFCGMNMDDGRTLQDYAITKESTVYCVIRHHMKTEESRIVKKRLIVDSKE